MQGKGRDWAIALGCIALLSIAISLVANLRSGRQILSHLTAEVERWRDASDANVPEQNTQQQASPAPQLPVYVPPGITAYPTASKPQPGQPAPKIDPRFWITPDDYPAEALRHDWQGRVRIEWTVDETGRPRDCKVMMSSGHPVLDEAACNAIMRRADYSPALNAEGEPIVSKDRRSVVWALPD